MNIALPKIARLDKSRKDSFINKINNKTKPIGSLGILEDIALKIALIQDSEVTQTRPASVFVFAGDHGCAKSGVSPYPQEVTSQMIRNFLEGGAAISVFSRQHQLDLKIIDCGTSELIDDPALTSLRLGHSTADFTKAQHALSKEQFEQAIENGRKLVETHKDMKLICLGEMGIGNSSAASCISALILKKPIDELICAGSGCDEKQLAYKKLILKKALDRYTGDYSALDIMRYFGGFELVTALGSMFEAASQKLVILIDGFIMSSVALIAYEISPAIADYFIFSHKSASKGHKFILEHMQARAILDLEMRLGEASGCAVCFPIIESASKFFNEMASFEEAKVSKKL